jgi:putative DNA primase/helicase
VISNELPKLGDASTAIVGRFVALISNKSWLGKEDTELENKILPELSGILNFGLDGLERLVTNGDHFTRVREFDKAIIEMRDLASPVAAFVRQRCLIDKDRSVKVDELYAAYKTWADVNGHRAISKETFGRDLRAVVPGLYKSHPREDGDQFWQYEGVDIDQNRGSHEYS